MNVDGEGWSRLIVEDEDEGHGVIGCDAGGHADDCLLDADEGWGESGPGDLG